MQRLITDIGLKPDEFTLQTLLTARIAATPNAPAARYWRHESFQTDTWTALDSRVSCLRHKLDSVGVLPGDTVGLLLPTGYVWALADWACIGSGFVTAVYHAGWRHAELKHALLMKMPRVVLCAPQLRDTLTDLLNELDNPSVVITLPSPDDADFDTFWRHQNADQLSNLLIDGNAVTTIVFTSGTAGDAKGVELSQNALLRSAWDAYFQLGFNAQGCNTLHWLPLSHLFGRVGLYIDVIAGTVAHFSRGVERLADDIALSQAHILFAVPQVLTRLRHRIEARVRSKAKITQLLFLGFQSLGRGVNCLPIGLSLTLQPVIRRWLFPSLHRSLGGNLQVIIAGGAPVDCSDIQYFEALGISIREGYGMTETAGVAAVQPLRRLTEGAGPLISGVTGRVAENGELLLKGPVMLCGYLSSTAYGADGWFRTGDIAKINSAGHLIIEGRIKDLIIPCSGENVSPSKIEAILCRHPWIADVCLTGDGRPCLVAVIALSDIARDAVLKLGCDHVRNGIDNLLQEINRDLPKYERVHGHVLAVDGFHALEGALTVTQKKRRAAIAVFFSAELDECYTSLQHRSKNCDSLEPLATA